MATSTTASSTNINTARSAGEGNELLITASDSWIQQHNRFDTLGKLWRRLAHYRIPIDLLLYSQSQVAERRHWLSHVISRAYREGRLLHDQP
jgi:uncharacterized protein